MDKQELEQKLIRKFPFEIRKKMVLREVVDLPAPAATAMTEDKRTVLVFYNTELLLEAGKDVDIETIGVHEMYHYLFAHTYIDPPQKYLDMWKNIDTLDEKQKEELSNHNQKRLAATDCEVNSFIGVLQRDPYCYPQKFKLPLAKSWDWYYDNLPDNPLEQKCAGGKDCEHGQPQDGCGGQKKMRVLCSEGLSPEQKKALRQAMEKEAKSMGYDLEPNPTPVKNGPPPPQRVKRGVRAAIERILGQELHNKFERTRSFTRPHKWKEDGYPGKVRMIGPKLMFAIDCSGSTTGAQQKSYYAITRRLLKEYPAVVVEFDDAIKHVGKRPSFTEWGGGTNMQPVQKKAKELGVDAIVWFTDAHGSWHKPDPAIKDIIVLTDKSGLETAKIQGRVVPQYER